MTTNIKLFYSVPEIAAVLRISKAKVFLMLKNHELGYMKIGHRTIIPKKALEDYQLANFKPVKTND